MTNYEHSRKNLLLLSRSQRLPTARLATARLPLSVCVGSRMPSRPPQQRRWQSQRGKQPSSSLRRYDAESTRSRQGPIGMWKSVQQIVPSSTQSVSRRRRRRKKKQTRTRKRAQIDNQRADLLKRPPAAPRPVYAAGKSYQHHGGKIYFSAAKKGVQGVQASLGQSGSHSARCFRSHR